MSSVKIAITLDRETLIRVDGLVSKSIFPNRSRAIQAAVSEKLKTLSVRETKNGGERESELQKIHCATEHFKEIGMYDYAKSTPEDWRV